MISDLEEMEMRAHRIGAAIHRHASLEEIRAESEYLAQSLGSLWISMVHMSCGTIALYLVVLLIKKLIQEQRL